MAGKMLGLLTEIAPVKRAAIVFNPGAAAGGGSYFLPIIEAAARSLNPRIKQNKFCSGYDSDRLAVNLLPAPRDQGGGSY
jgi:hypothetical protein